MTIGRVIRIAIGVVLFAAVGWFLIWTNQVMPAEQQYVTIIEQDPNITVRETSRSIILSSSDYHAKTGIVFLPGAKVDPRAYLYKLSGIVESTGITVVITKPYFNLALFDLRPISSFTNDVNDIEKWYVGGHSLGGVRACQYAADPSARVAGLILFGAYCNNDVTLPTLSIRGEEDKLTSEQDITDNQDHLKGTVTTYEIDSASHASFGNYGQQSGDGVASINEEFMRLEISDQMMSWLAGQ